MIYNYTVTLEAYDLLAKEVLRGWQYQVYKVKVRAFLGLIGRKLGSFIIDDSKDKKVFCESSEDKTYLEAQKKKLEEFLYSDYKTLSKDENKVFAPLVYDRFIQKLSKHTHKAATYAKAKALKLSLGEGNILSFFNSIGIGIKIEITEIP